MTEYEPDEHSEDCECIDCIGHEDDCPCEACYQRQVIKADRQRADWIWEREHAAVERMADLMGFTDEDTKCYSERDTKSE